jgi:hypothetical protein
MDVKSYMIELGYSEEDATTYANDPKLAKIVTAAASRYEEGNQAKTAAEQAAAEAAQKSADLAKWWKDTAQPAILNADGGTATARAEAAKYQAYIKSLKESGYPVPDEMLATTKAPPAVVPPAHQDNFDPRQAAIDMARQTAMVADLDSEYRELFGSSIPGGLSGMLEESLAAGKSLRDHVRAKFNFDGKRQELAAKKETDRVAAITKDLTEKLEAKYASRSNPNLAPAVIAKGVAVAEANKDHADSWKTRDGRREAKIDRLDRFKGLKIAS